MKRLDGSRELHSFTPAQSLFPKHHMGFIETSGHRLSVGSCADGSGSSQEAARAKANLRHLKWMQHRPKSAVR